MVVVETVGAALVETEVEDEVATGDEYEKVDVAVK